MSKSNLLINALGILTIIVVLFLNITLIRQNNLLNAYTSHEKDLPIGSKAYLFTALDINGTRITTKDRNTLLIFLNPDCTTCSENWSSYIQLSTSYNTKDLQVVFITSLTTRDFSIFMEGHPDLNVPIIADPDEKLFLNYSVRSVPQIVLIDKFGNIAYYSSPRQNAIESLSEIEHEIISLLNKEKTIDR